MASRKDGLGYQTHFSYNPDSGISSMNLGELLSCSEHLFPHLENGEYMVLMLWDY